MENQLFEFEQINGKAEMILHKMQSLKNGSGLKERCPISIIDMDAWEWPQGVALFSMYLY